MAKLAQNDQINPMIALMTGIWSTPENQPLSADVASLAGKVLSEHHKVPKKVKEKIKNSLKPGNTTAKEMEILKNELINITKQLNNTNTNPTVDISDISDISDHDIHQEKQLFNRPSHLSSEEIILVDEKAVEQIELQIENNRLPD